MLVYSMHLMHVVNGAFFQVRVDTIILILFCYIFKSILFIKQELA